MIYLSDEFLDTEKLFRVGAFTKRSDSYYFVAEEREAQYSYLCMKLFNGLHDDRFEMEVVEVVVDWKKNEEIVDEVEVYMKKDRDIVMESFFRIMRHTSSTEAVKMFEGIFGFVEDNLSDGYSFSEGKRVFTEFLSIFELGGVISEGFYEGTIVLTDVAFKNKTTGEVIIKFKDIPIEGIIDAKDEEELEEILEQYAGSISEYEIKELLSKRHS